MEKFDYLNLNGKLLRLFLSVYDNGSVNGAMEQLDLNQSTISYSLDRLRKAFDDPLFVKSGRGILPTERAKEIAPKIRELLVDMELLASKDKYHPSEDNSLISIAANVMELLPYLNALHKEIISASDNASVKFLELGSRENIHSLLDTQTVDIVISVRPTELNSSLNTKPIFSFDQVCYFDGSKRNSIETIEEYCNAGHAVLDFGGVTKSTIDHTLSAMSMSRKIKLRAPNIAALARMIRGTSLITTMQTDLSNHAMSGLDYSFPPLSVPKVNIDMIWHRRSEYSGRNVWLRNLILSTLHSYRHPMNILK